MFYRNIWLLKSSMKLHIRAQQLHIFCKQCKCIFKLVPKYQIQITRFLKVFSREKISLFDLHSLRSYFLHSFEICMSRGALYFKTNMALSSEDLLVSLPLYRRRGKMKSKNTNRFWVRKIFPLRKEKGEFTNLVREMRLHDHEFFLKCFEWAQSNLRSLQDTCQNISTDTDFKSNLQRKSWTTF